MRSTLTRRKEALLKEYKVAMKLLPSDEDPQDGRVLREA
jgi:hypothetical protein